MVRLMAIRPDDDIHVTRRGFLGFGAALTTVALVPGAAVLLTATPAAAAPAKPSPYNLASWEGLLQSSVVIASSTGASQTLQVIRVTNLTQASTAKMTGEVFTVGFQAEAPVAPGIYTVTAPGMGRFPLYLGGATATQALVNRRVPATS